MKVTGDWQKHKGIEGAEGTLQVAEEKPSKLDLFNQALEEANNGPTAEAITEKRRKAKEDAEAKAAAEAEAAAKAAADEEASKAAEADAAESSDAASSDTDDTDAAEENADAKSDDS